MVEEGGAKIGRGGRKLKMKKLILVDSRRWNKSWDY